MSASGVVAGVEQRETALFPSVSSPDDLALRQTGTHHILQGPQDEGIVVHDPDSDMFSPIVHYSPF